LDSYVTSLFNSQLPFDAWIVALTWLVLFFANHWIARSARAANQSQALAAVEDWSILRRSSESKYILAQFLFASMVFSFGVFLGGPAFVFFAGGLLVAIACTLSLSVQALLSARSMADPDAAMMGLHTSAHSEEHMSAVDVIQQQVEAYNDRDLDRFVSTYSDTIAIYRMPAVGPFISGKIQLGEFYATQRFNLPGLRADIVNRIALGNKVIDHERIWGVRAGPFEIAVAYEVVDGLIERVWTFPSE